jgi:hypothetical protein
MVCVRVKRSEASVPTVMETSRIRKAVAFADKRTDFMRLVLK